jgi:hypothetical protein
MKRSAALLGILPNGVGQTDNRRRVVQPAAPVKQPARRLTICPAEQPSRNQTEKNGVSLFPYDVVYPERHHAEKGNAT